MNPIELEGGLFLRAVNSPEFKAITEPLRQQFPHFPSIYQAHRRVVGSDGETPDE